ncbi:MAG: exo-alpha-sialidase, partial [Actinomycetota bacterium]|nr:exo-alpha-sialidase [Actinomycetota bacterium]
MLASLLGSSSTTTSAGSEERAHGDKELPTALGAHLEQLKEAIPGNGGESDEGPGSAAEAEFLERAYPRNTISFGQSLGAQQAFRQATARFSKLAPNAPGTWHSVGPSRALYPFSELRNSSNYVPNRYVAGGRTTDVAIAPTCSPGDCRLWVTPAGGGIWRTDNALAATPQWTYLGGPLGINAAGTVTVDPSDPSGNTIWVGTGEANICGSGCVAGVGLYKSTNGGDSWVGPLGRRLLGGKGIGDVVVDPTDGNIVYAATTTALRGMSSVCCSGVARPVPGAAKWGLYKTTDGGHHWAFIHNGSADPSQCSASLAQFNNLKPCSPRGVRDIELDPFDPNTIYASSYARGIWRSTDAGASWVQIKDSLNPALIQTRAAFDVTALANGNTRMYVYEGNYGDPYARLFRSDDVATGVPTFTDLTSANPADPGYATYNQCGGQCWYDLFVYTPDGHPNMVYTGGSYSYGETGGISNGRAVVRSTDAGVSGTDMTMDGTDPLHPNGLHPDQHSLVTDPNNPNVFFETNDGGIMRSNGAFSDRSSWCDTRGLAGDDLTRCQQLLSKVPQRLRGINTGLNTLQFLSLSVSPFDARLLQGGTQDNGTWQNNDHVVTWRNTMIGDGGQSGFDAEKPNFRFHTFYDASPDVNFAGGDTAKWIWTGDPIFGQPGTQFYVPIIS